LLVIHGIGDVDPVGEELGAEGKVDGKAEGSERDLLLVAELGAAAKSSGEPASPVGSGGPVWRGLFRDAFKNLAAAKPTTKSPPKTTSGLRRAYDSKS